MLSAVEKRVVVRRSAIGGHCLRPWENFTSVAVPVTQRPPLTTLGL
ncbi:MAG: hypothetical protein ACRDPA_18855 [Solirubrobacteraceae bacterium]